MVLDKCHYLGWLAEEAAERLMFGVLSELSVLNVIPAKAGIQKVISH